MGGIGVFIAHKQSLRQGNVFTGLSTRGGGLHSGGDGSASRMRGVRGGWAGPLARTRTVDGMHPNGMLPCS